MADNFLQLIAHSPQLLKELALSPETVKEHTDGVFKAIIFDFDGVLLDTETLEYQVFSELYADYGMDLPLSQWQKGVGTWNAFDPWQAFSGYDPSEIQQQRQKVHHAIIERIQRAPLCVGVLETLQDAQASGIRLAVASSSDAAWVEGWAKDKGIDHFFESFSTRYEVAHFKPAPDLYLLALNKLGLRAEDCIAIEDSVNGATAALAAHLRCTVVPNAVTEGMTFPASCRKIDNLHSGLAKLKQVWS